MERIRAGIIGSTGMVGQRFVRMLDEHPYFELVMLTSSERSVGMKYGEYVNWSLGNEMPEYVRERELKRTTTEEIKKNEVDVVFSALPTAPAKDIERDLAKEDIPVFSNARANRMEEKVPILVPEINSEHLDIIKHQNFERGFIVTNSNCTASGLTMGLYPLLELGVRSVNVVTYQALSGAGLTGVPSLAILGNVIPFIRNEEEAMEAETKKILGRFDHEKGRIVELETPVHASCARVPVINGHLENVNVEFEGNVETDELERIWKNFRGPAQELRLPSAPESPVLFMDQEDRPQPAMDVNAGKPEMAAGMAVSVGCVRKKEDNMINFWVLVHNTVRGAAGASMLNAEYAFKKGVFRERGIC